MENNCIELAITIPFVTFFTLETLDGWLIGRGPNELKKSIILMKMNALPSSRFERSIIRRKLDLLGNYYIKFLSPLHPKALVSLTKFDKHSA